MMWLFASFSSLRPRYGLGAVLVGFVDSRIRTGCSPSVSVSMFRTIPSVKQADGQWVR